MAYDSSLRAMRWCMNRIESTGGVIGFITNGSFLDSAIGKGVRKTIAKEMSAVYVLNLRGDARTQGETRRTEGGNVFGGGSRVRVCIILMAKKVNTSEDKPEPCKLYYHDIGDYKSRDEKLSFLRNHADMELIHNIPWKKKSLDDDGNWIVDLHADFDKFLPLTNDKLRRNIANWSNQRHKPQLQNIPSPQSNESCFAFCDLFSRGVETSRDAWACNFSRKKVEQNMKRMVAFYHGEIERMKKSGVKFISDKDVEKFVHKDGGNIKWTSSLLSSARRGISAEFQTNKIRKHFYRPFAPMYIYYDSTMNHRVFRTPFLFNKKEENPSICMSGKTSNWGVLACRDMCGSGFLDGCAQMLPFYSYASGKRDENISDYVLKIFHNTYGKKVSKWDIFHYAYGVLNHPHYKQLFAGNLRYDFATLPMVRTTHFNGFVKSGKKLMDLHMNYENAAEAKLNRVGDKGRAILTGIEESVSSDITPDGMRFPGGNKNKLQFNSALILDIPSKAHEYKICGRSPLEWVVDRYKLHSLEIPNVSGIMNDPKDWEKEQNHPGYILSLVKKSVTIGEKSVDIIAALPPLEYDLKDQPPIPKKEK